MKRLIVLPSVVAALIVPSAAYAGGVVLKVQPASPALTVAARARAVAQDQTAGTAEPICLVEAPAVFPHSA